MRRHAMSTSNASGGRTRSRRRVVTACEDIHRLTKDAADLENIFIWRYQVVKAAVARGRLDNAVTLYLSLVPALRGGRPQRRRSQIRRTRRALSEPARRDLPATGAVPGTAKALLRSSVIYRRLAFQNKEYLRPLAVVLNNQGALFEVLADHRSSLTALEEAKASFQKHYAGLRLGETEDGELAACLDNLGFVTLLRANDAIGRGDHKTGEGDLQSAKGDLDDAHQIIQRLRGRPLDMAKSTNNRGLYHLSQGGYCNAIGEREKAAFEYAEALHLMSDALKRFREIYKIDFPKGHTIEAECLRNRALIHLKLGDMQEAIRMLKNPSGSSVISSGLRSASGRIANSPCRSTA